MKIKTGDKVKILVGKDRGKTGKVLQALVEQNKVVVEGLNLMIKHQRPKRQGEKGQRLQFPSPLAASKVVLICPKCDRPTRVGFSLSNKEVTEGRKKTKLVKNRICQKCKEIIS